MPLLKKERKMRKERSGEERAGLHPNADPACWKPACSLALPPRAQRPGGTEKGWRDGRSQACGDSGGALGRPRRASKAKSTRGSHSGPPPRDSGTVPGASGPHLPPRPPPLSVNGLAPVGLTASAARRLSPPSRSTTSFLLFPPAPPRVATSATALPVTRARQLQCPAWSHPFPRPARPENEREAAVDKISEHARARKRSCPT